MQNEMPRRKGDVRMKVAFALVAAIGLSACQTTQQPAYVMHPVEECGYVDEPVYGLLNRPTSDGEILLGALVGGVIGKELTDKDGGAVVGALLGGSVAQQNRVVERTVVGTNRVYKCQTIFK